MSQKRRLRCAVGDVLRIPLGSEKFAFAWVLSTPLFAFFDYQQDGELSPAVDELVMQPIAFRIWVMDRAVGDGRWKRIGHAAVPSETALTPWFFKQDPISRDLSLTQTGAEEVPASPEECRGLERAAVWDPEHVEDRLRDHFAGMPNKWVQSTNLRA